MDTVQSVKRTFDIIEALSQNPKGAFLSEISHATALNKTTAYRLLNSLIRFGYAAKDEETGKYFLTVKMFEIGSKVVNQLDILTVARPYLEKLSNTAGEAVHLVVRKGSEIMYVLKEDSGNNSVRMSSRIGLRSPMYCTAVGKAILADLSDAEAEDVWNISTVERRTGHTITTFGELKDQLALIRRQGYAVDDEENELGVRCVGASIVDFSGRTLGAFSISAPVVRMDDSRINEIAALVLRTRKEICAVMGKTWS